MTILIIGYPDSGKSELAENMVMELSSPDHRIYMATMIPYGDEGRERIARHRGMRAGKGFTTVEVPFDVSEAAMLHEQEEGALKDCTILLECVSNLVANELFQRHKEPKEAAGKIIEDIRILASSAGNLVIVSNHYAIEDGFDADTVMYAETLDRINDHLMKFADRTIHLEQSLDAGSPENSMDGIR